MTMMTFRCSEFRNANTRKELRCTTVPPQCKNRKADVGYENDSETIIRPTVLESFNSARNRSGGAYPPVTKNSNDSSYSSLLNFALQRKLFRLSGIIKNLFKKFHHLLNFLFKTTFPRRAHNVTKY